MSETLQLPEVHEGVLDAAGVRALAADIAACAELLAVVVKRHPRAHAGAAGTPRLEEACEELLRGALRGLQLRYRHQGQEWWDTLLPAPGGYRVVRIAHAS